MLMAVQTKSCRLCFTKLSLLRKELINPQICYVYNNVSNVKEYKLQKRNDSEDGYSVSPGRKSDELLTFGVK